MREIKFNAWDQVNKVMLYDVSTGTIEIWCSKTGKKTQAKDCIFLQYANLKDKNGKEIYEGDILIVCRLHDGHDKYWKQPNGPAIPTLVTWDEKNLCWEMPCDTYNFEAIGNIHENPDLLK